MMCVIAAVLGTWLLTAPTEIRAQTVAPSQEPQAVSTENEETGVELEDALRVYMDCAPWICDDDFLRTEIRFVDYVRDRYAAQVHLLVTRQQTGGGGQVYTLNFIGREAFDGEADTLTWAAPQGATSDERRRGIAHAMALGLVRYVAHSPLADGIQVAFDPPEGFETSTESGQGSPADDPWNHWVLRLGLDGSLDGASSERAADFGVSISADRTTSAWKAGLDARFGYDEERIELSDQLVHTIDRTYHLGGSLVRSVGGNVSTGLRASIRRPRARENRERAVRVAPAVQYNIFPYEDWNRRRLVVTYSTGARDVRYHEETIYFKMQEVLYDHQLEVAYSARQPWGSAGLDLSGSHYLSYPDRYRFRVGGNLDLQLTRGLSFDLNGSFERVNDQVGLPAGDASLEDVLLQRRQLETDYEYRVRIGFGYTFGSIFNNVVNPRLGGW